MAKLCAYQTDRVVELPMNSWIIILPLTALMQSEGERERDQQPFEPTLVTPETDNNGRDGGQNNAHPV